MSRTVRWGLSSTPSTPWHTGCRTCTKLSALDTWASAMPWSLSTAANSWTSSSSPRSSVCRERKCGLMTKEMLLEGKAAPGRSVGSTDLWALLSQTDGNSGSFGFHGFWVAWGEIQWGNYRYRAHVRRQWHVKMLKAILVNTVPPASCQCHPPAQLSPQNTGDLPTKPRNQRDCTWPAGLTQALPAPGQHPSYWLVPMPSSLWNILILCLVKEVHIWREQRPTHISLFLRLTYVPLGTWKKKNFLSVFESVWLPKK